MIQQMFKTIKIKFEPRFVRNVITLVAGTSIAQAIPIIATPILTRMYSPEEFGLFAFYISIVSIISVVCSGRYELAILIPKEDKNAINIVVICLFICFVVSLTLFMFVFIFFDDILEMLGNKEIGHWLYLIPVSVFLTGFYQVFNYWNNRKSRYKLLARNRVGKSLCLSGTQVTMGFQSILVGGLFIGSILSIATGLMFMIIKTIKLDYKLIDKIDVISLKEVAYKYKNFPLVDGPTAFLSLFANQAPNMLLATIYSPAIAGFYYLTQRVFQAPITLISASVLDVFKQKASDDYHNNGTAKPIFKKTFFSLAIIGSVPIILLYIFVEDIFIYIFGDQWLVAGQYLKILLPVLYFKFIVNPLSFMIYIAEKQKWNFFCMFFLFISVFMSLYIPDNPLQTIKFLSISYSFYYVVHLILSYSLTDNIKFKRY